MQKLGASSKFRMRNQIIEETSEIIFKRRLPKEWIVRKQIPDYGIDYEIEICKKCFNDIDKYVLTGNIIWVQLKATDSVNLINEEVKFTLETGLINYATKTTIPVILVVVDTSSEKVYWINLRRLIHKRFTEGQYQIILNRTSSTVWDLKELDKSSFDEWIRLSEQNHIIQEMLLNKYLHKKATNIIADIKTKKYNRHELTQIIEKLKSHISPDNYPTLAYEDHGIINNEIIEEFAEIDGSDFNLEYIDQILEDISEKLNILDSDIDRWIEKKFIL